MERKYIFFKTSRGFLAPFLLFWVLIIPFAIIAWFFDFSEIGGLILSFLFALLVSHIAFEVDRRSK
jgi:hypothetical protein